MVLFAHLDRKGVVYATITTLIVADDGRGIFSRRGENKRNRRSLAWFDKKKKERKRSERRKSTAGLLLTIVNETIVNVSHEHATFHRFTFVNSMSR